MWREGDSSNSQTHASCDGVLGSAKGQLRFFPEAQPLCGSFSWLHSPPLFPPPATQITVFILYPPSVYPSECLCHSYSARNSAAALLCLLGRAQRELLALINPFSLYVTTAPLHTPSIACSQSSNSRTHQILCPAYGPLHMPFLGPDFNPSVPYLVCEIFYIWSGRIRCFLSFLLLW